MTFTVVLKWCPLVVSKVWHPIYDVSFTQYVNTPKRCHYNTSFLTVMLRRSISWFQWQTIAHCISFWLWPHMCTSLRSIVVTNRCPSKVPSQLMNYIDHRWSGLLTARKKCTGKKYTVFPSQAKEQEIDADQTTLPFLDTESFIHCSGRIHNSPNKTSQILISVASKVPLHCFGSVCCTC